MSDQQPETDEIAPKPPKMVARPSSILERMQNNPRGDWTIGDIETLCGQVGMTCAPPTRGSHYKVSSPFLDGALTVPYNRPIKVFYIRSLIALATSHLSVTGKLGDKK